MCYQEKNIGNKKTKVKFLINRLKKRLTLIRIFVGYCLYY